MIRYKIHAVTNYEFVKVVGAPDLEAYIESAIEFIDDPDFFPGIHRICDFSKADLSAISLSDVKKFADFAREHVLLAAGSKVALVPPSTRFSGIFESFISRMGNANVQLFADQSSAMAWIIDPDIHSLEQHGGERHSGLI